MVDDITGSVNGPAAVRPHVEAVLEQSTVRATWRVSPTAYADGWIYTVEVSAFVSRYDVERMSPRRYITAPPVN